MAKAFGTWLRDYSGENKRLQTLSQKWTAHLRMDYLRANSYTRPQDVYDAMASSFGHNSTVERLVELAYEVHKHRLYVTKTRFLSSAPAYRPDPDVPTWPPIWE